MRDGSQQTKYMSPSRSPEAIVSGTECVAVAEKTERAHMRSRRPIRNSVLYQCSCGGAVGSGGPPRGASGDLRVLLEGGAATRIEDRLTAWMVARIS